MGSGQALLTLTGRKRTLPPWVTAEILDLCDTEKDRTEKEKIRIWRIWPIQGSEQQNQEVHEKGKRKLDRRIVQWDRWKSEEEQQSKRAYLLVKDLTTVKQGEATTIKDRSQKCLTEERKMQNRWTEYCAEAVQSEGRRRSISTGRSPDRHIGRPSHPLPRSGGCSTTIEERDVSWSWQLPAELVRAGGEEVITALTTNCNKIWQTGEWPTHWTQSLVNTLPKKSNLQQCQNYRNISLISHPSKVMLKIILNRLKPQAEKIITEQAGFRSGRSTTKQISTYESFVRKSSALASPVPYLHRLFFYCNTRKHSSES